MWSAQSPMVGTLAGQRRQAAGEEVAEGLAGGVDVAAVAVDEVHRHVEQVVDIALEAHAGLETKGRMPQRSGSVSVQTWLR
jgi:hypothetical protein